MGTTKRNILQTSGLLPFAVLSNTDSKTNTLQEVATLIDNITDKRTQNNLAACAFILAGLVLEEEVIQRLLQRDIMRESVTYQSLLAEGRDQGIRRVAINMLKEGMSIEVVAKVTGLTVEQVQQLQTAEAEKPTE
ncbi:hypothetical protein [Nostoc sp.]|uniref:hypothetical protein n=1 Tax=Nostoc sp. TaxID=1180 RepID=UPI002FFACF33